MLKLTQTGNKVGNLSLKGTAETGDNSLNTCNLNLKHLQTAFLTRPRTVLYVLRGQKMNDGSHRAVVTVEKISSFPARVRGHRFSEIKI